MSIDRRSSSLHVVLHIRIAGFCGHFLLRPSQIPCVILQTGPKGAGLGLVCGVVQFFLIGAIGRGGV